MELTDRESPPRRSVLLGLRRGRVGAAIYLVRHGRSPADYGVFRSEPSNLRHVGAIFRDALALSAAEGSFSSDCSS
jgi:hypothetical protein